jgi:DNA-directed RNA polymerase specialized sigma24 family protein
MKCSPLNARLIGITVPHILTAVRRRFPNVRNEMLLDAASAAVERCITDTFSHRDRSSGEMYRWLLTATVHELLRELRLARRYVDFEAHASRVEAIAGEHRSDAGAAYQILWRWLVRRFGTAIAETVWLHSIEGCPPRDIAAMLNISVESIKARITRTRRVIRRHVNALD